MAYDDFNATAGSGVCEYLTESQSLVILYLSIRSSRETGEAFPSQTRIAYETGLKRRRCKKRSQLSARLDIIRSRRAWSQTSRTLATYYRVAPQITSMPSSQNGTGSSLPSATRPTGS